MNNLPNHIPPKWPLRLLRRVIRAGYLEEIEGDMEEVFQDNLGRYSLKKARRLYAWESLKLLRPALLKNMHVNHSIIHFDMLRHNFLISWRHLTKNKGYSLLNIGGLAMGMAVAMLIGLWIRDELAFDTNHQNHDRIAAVLQNQDFNGEIQTWWGQAKQLAPELRESYGSNFKYVTIANWMGGHTLSHEDKTLTRSGIFMEPDAPHMLTLNMISGSRSGLVDPYSILLSASTAKAFFAGEDPVHKIIRLNDKSEVKVTGVYEDLPSNSSFADMHFMAPWALYEKDLPEWLGWGNSWFQTFVQIADHADMAQVSTLIKDVKLEKGGEGNAKFKPQLFLHPMSKWHLYSTFKQGINVGGRVQYLWLFGIIGGFVLLLACINFMNLSTARSEKRAREVGVRKAIGSSRGQLINQFFGESLLITVFAFGLAVIGVWLMLPFFNEVAGKEITLLWFNPLFWLSGIGFALFTGILAGSYPALYLSSFQAVKVLKGTFRVSRLAAIPRKALVVVQFTVSVSMMIGTIIVFQQIQFAKNRPVGYDYNNLVTVPIKNDEIHQHFEAFRNELMQTGAVAEVAKSESPIVNTWITNSGLDWKGKDPDMQDEFVTVRVSHEFGKTVGWEIKEGRDFSRGFATDSFGFVINEAAAAYMGLENPVGETMKWGNNGIYTIIGVVKNMITQSPYADIRQMIFFLDYKRSNFTTIKINPGVGTGEAMAKIETIFKKYDPVNPFEYQFMDHQYAQKFGEEERIGKLAGFFAILAILISCLGMFGMASFVAEQRTKEIGIRKVLGASVANLWRLLSKDFVILVLIACLIAIPIAWYFLHGWLQNYTYRTEISGWVFAAAGLGALLLTLLTVSFQAIKAAAANPVDSLRSE